jgi:3-hydroxyacyl-[acyl-carrier-protein] dehydratase
MLIPDFYSIQKIDVAVGTITANIRLNPKHEVYKGHFPGQPVVPGVIQLQIVKEILEETLSQQLLMNKVSSAKYLRIITPGNSKELQITIQYSKTEENEFKVNALISSLETIFTKVKMKLK